MARHQIKILIDDKECAIKLVEFFEMMRIAIGNELTHCKCCYCNAVMESFNECKENDHNRKASKKKQSQPE